MLCIEFSRTITDFPGDSIWTILFLFFLYVGVLCFWEYKGKYNEKWKILRVGYMAAIEMYCCRLVEKSEMKSIMIRLIIWKFLKQLFEKMMWKAYWTIGFLTKWIFPLKINCCVRSQSLFTIIYIVRLDRLGYIHTKCIASITLIMNNSQNFSSVDS